MIRRSGKQLCVCVGAEVSKRSAVMLSTDNMITAHQLTIYICIVSIESFRVKCGLRAHIKKEPLTTSVIDSC